MPTLATQIDPRSPDFRANADSMAGLVTDLRRLADNIRQGGGERARQRHLSRGKLLPRDRIRALVDPLSPFLEIGQLAAHGVYEEDIHEGNWLGGETFVSFDRQAVALLAGQGQPTQLLG